MKKKTDLSHRIRQILLVRSVFDDRDDERIEEGESFPYSSYADSFDHLREERKGKERRRKKRIKRDEEDRDG